MAEEQNKFSDAQRRVEGLTQLRDIENVGMAEKTVARLATMERSRPKRMGKPRQIDFRQKYMGIKKMGARIKTLEQAL